MPAKKHDLSALVSLTLSPSEAAIVAGALAVLCQRPENLTPSAKSVLEGTLGRIDLQLRHLQWPEQLRRQPPFPV